MKYETCYVIVDGVAWILTFDGAGVQAVAPELRAVGDEPHAVVDAAHSERAHLRGGESDFHGPAMEIATRELILGSPVLA